MPSQEQLTDISARPINELLIYLGEHAIAVGATGSGKTVFTIRGLLDYLQAIYPEVPRYIVDSTADPDMKLHVPDGIFVEGNKPPDLLHNSDRTLVWTPNNSKIPKAYSAWFDTLNDSRKKAIIVIDEIASMVRDAADALETLFKQMRKHGGTVIAETQEIAKVDTTYFRQASHFFLFNISPEPYDLQMARKYLNIDKESFHLPTNKYGFYHRKTRGNFPAEEFIDYHHFFGRS